MYYCRWENLAAKVDGMNLVLEFMPHNTTGSTCKIHSGQKSFLSQTEPELKRCMLQLHEQSIQLTNGVLWHETACLLSAFKEKNT